ncbi:MAG: 30S ribosome-binding factor RbfA [Desulfurobacteriaceae bacterium]
MRGVRRERLKSLLLREISDIVRFEVDLPEGLFITISAVELNKDATKATVFVSGLKPEDVALAVERLNRASGFIHRLLGKRLRLKVVPRPEFVIAPGVMS